MSFENLKCPRCGSSSVSAHAEPVPATGEAELWVPVRDEGFMCSDCGLIESCLNSAGDKYRAFNQRWNCVEEPFDQEAHNAYLAERDRREEEEARAWTWPTEEGDIHDRAWRDNQLAQMRKETFSHTTVGRDGLVFSQIPEVPRNEVLLAESSAHPDDEEPRWQIAEWLRGVDHPMATRAAQFIEGQLGLAKEYSVDPLRDGRESLPFAVFGRRQQPSYSVPDILWWRLPEGELYKAMNDSLHVLRELGLVADQRYYRGLVEHVSIKASRFLEIADELYSLAPIRQLTLTYCKGRDHQDVGVLKALLQSPHLDRIRGLKLPLRKFGQDMGDVTELNRITDDDIALLADSDHLRGLRYLDLEDQRRVTVVGFDALARSRKLPELSAVFFDLNDYRYPGTFSFGRVGKQTRTLRVRPLNDLREQLEARHGHIPWLHLAENYGSETPDVEAVIEHPVALRRRA